MALYVTITGTTDWADEFIKNLDFKGRAEVVYPDDAPEIPFIYISKDRVYASFDQFTYAKNAT